MSVIEIVGGAILLVVSAVIILLTLMQHTLSWPVCSPAVWPEHPCTAPCKAGLFFCL